MSDKNDILTDELDDAQVVEFIKNYLPQDFKETFTDNHLYYLIDLIDEYYFESGVLDEEPDEDGYVSIDLDKVVDYLQQEAKKDEVGEFGHDELLFVVQGEMEYGNSLDE
ncbi:MAG: hypothetical protein ACRC9P_04100 [Bacteroides sp.]